MFRLQASPACQRDATREGVSQASHHLKILPLGLSEVGLGNWGTQQQRACLPRGSEQEGLGPA